MRAIFFDEDAARAVLARLSASGFEASLRREQFAGEDDDEDQPWALISDAPEFVVEILVDEYDGWLDHDDEPGGPEVSRPPLDLPTAPKRIKRS